LIWSEFLTAMRTNQAQAARASGASFFDYYADHPDEAAIFRATMQSVSMETALFRTVRNEGICSSMPKTDADRASQ
jgi:hypothetical protein